MEKNKKKMLKIDIKFYLISGAMVHVHHKHKKIEYANVSFLLNRENLIPKILKVTL